MINKRGVPRNVSPRARRQNQQQLPLAWPHSSSSLSSLPFQIKQQQVKKTTATKKAAPAKKAVAKKPAAKVRMMKKNKRRRRRAARSLDAPLASTDRPAACPAFSRRRPPPPSRSAGLG